MSTGSAIGQRALTPGAIPKSQFLVNRNCPWVVSPDREVEGSDAEVDDDDGNIHGHRSVRCVSDGSSFSSLFCDVRKLSVQQPTIRKW